MDRRSLGLAPTSPRLTMRALLVTACIIATVPSAEALVSHPSISSSTGIAMAVVSVAAALSLVVVIAMMIGEFAKNAKLARMKRAEKRNVEAAQPRPTEMPLQPEINAPVVHDKPPEENINTNFYEFINKWNQHSPERKDEFLVSIFKKFPGAVTPSMVMNTLQTMLSAKTVDVDLWMPRMLPLIMMLERDLYHWDQTRMPPLRECEKTIPSYTHYEFQSYLLTQAEAILSKVGDMAEPNEAPEAGFMRFIAYLFGFVCNYKRILTLMDDTWTQVRFAQTDASRAMVWGYRRWKDDPRTRVKGSPTSTVSNGNHETFQQLMEELKATAPAPGVAVGTRAQHLLFALGCGYEPDPAQGPLALMRDKRFSLDYLWLMLGRDFVMGNAWQWMCEEGLSEHDRMAGVFGVGGNLYSYIVEMVMRYDQDRHQEKNMERYALNCEWGLALDIKFDEHRKWYERYLQAKSAIGSGMKAWLLKTRAQWEATKMEEENRIRQGQSAVRVAGSRFAVSVISNSKSSKKTSTTDKYDRKEMTKYDPLLKNLKKEKDIFEEIWKN